MGKLDEIGAKNQPTTQNEVGTEVAINPPGFPVADWRYVARPSSPALWPIKLFWTQ